MFRRLVQTQSLVSKAPLTVTNPWWFSAAHVATSAQRVDHYKRLGVEPTASAEEIKKAYRKMALKCHPDVVPAEQKTSAEIEFRRISESYTMLSNPSERSRYDATRPKTSPVSGTKPPKAKSAPKRTAASAQPKRKTPAQQKQRPFAGGGSAQGQKPTSGFTAKKPQEKKEFVRKHADSAFKDAFDGMTLEQVLFKARQAAKRAAMKEKKASSKVADEKSTATREQLSRERSKTSEERHSAAMQRSTLEAAEEVAKRMKQRYGPSILNKVKIPGQGGEEDAKAFYKRFANGGRDDSGELPSRTMDFRPFPHMLKQGLPEGVTALADPKPVGVVPLEEANATVEEILQPSPLDVEGRFDDDCAEGNINLMKPEERVPHLAWAKREKMREHSVMPDNMGHLYSYQRPY